MNMAEQAINHSTLAKLVESGSVRAAHVIGLAGGWGITVKCGKTVRPLAAQRGKVRLFSRLETVADYLKRIGIARFDVAAHDKWFRSQVQVALDDPRPGIPHEEVSARWQRKRSQLLKKLRATPGAKA